jgi:hypothetical protein
MTTLDVCCCKKENLLKTSDESFQLDVQNLYIDMLPTHLRVVLVINYNVIQSLVLTNN